ncbi:MAG TPA: type II toxin-antitoxin system prevent-host-death family antitoxin [Candidatus Marinimicrobia bacterium]|nr:type II toxin-antitoxin system prevent-host-death family antitoxin [Candidatus Neomarinimicrobiota bacterium]
MKNVWQLQEAKAKFSKVINEAIQHGPQIITKHGIETALLISINDYKQISKKESKISRFFKSSPLYNVELDIQRSKNYPRDIEL